MGSETEKMDRSERELTWTRVVGRSGGRWFECWGANGAEETSHWPTCLCDI